MNHFGLMSGIQGGGAVDAVRPGGDIFAPITDDADLMSRMDEEGFWEKYRSNPEIKGAINSYIFQDEQKEGAMPLTDYSSLGMSANKDMSGFAKAQPLQGLMGMAQYKNQPKGLFSF